VGKPPGKYPSREEMKKKNGHILDFNGRRSSRTLTAPVEESFKNRN